jgi:hypothetical protein
LRTIGSVQHDGLEHGAVANGAAEMVGPVRHGMIAGCTDVQILDRFGGRWKKLDRQIRPGDPSAIVNRLIVRRLNLFATRTHIKGDVGRTRVRDGQRVYCT